MSARLLLPCFVMLVWVSPAQGESHISPCMTDFGSQACLQAVRDLMMDPDRFWFGTNYSAECPPTSMDSECGNGDKEHLSIMTRLMKTNVTNADSITQVLNVTFQVPAGSYMACGNTYNVDAVTRIIDPVHASDIPLYSADHQPHVQWASSGSANRKYTLIVWDAGGLFLHGMFYNIQGTDLSNARVAFNYRGPKNPVARDQPYVFLLYTHSDDLDPNLVQNLLIASLQSSLASFTPVNIVNGLALGSPIGASILTVQTDPYAAGYMKDNKVVNKCPALLTPGFSALPLAYDVSNVRLTVSVDVTYRSPKISVTSCCIDVTVEMATRMANPLGNGHLDPVYARHPPHVVFEASNYFDSYYFFRNLYTLLMMDVTEDLDTSIADPNIVLHWQVVNIRQGDVMAGDTTWTYQAPLPLPGGPTRAVMFLLLRQKEPLNPISTDNLSRFTASDCPNHLDRRCRFNMTGFIMEHEMTIVGASWFMTSPDAYSLSEVIKMGLQDTATACNGVTGYDDPCPTCGASYARASTLALVLIALASCVKSLL